MTRTPHHTPTYYRIRTAVRVTLVALIAVTCLEVGKALADESFACDGSAVVAVTGDTLWSLVERHCTGHTASAVDALYVKHGELSYGEVVSFAIEG